MAVPGITCPEKFIVPLYFRPEEQGEISKLFQKDSIFEHLFDPWKPEAVKGISYEDLSLLKYMHSHFIALKSPIFASLKQSKDRFTEIIKQLTNGVDVYSSTYSEIYMKNLTALDNDIMINILKFYAILEEHKRIYTIKYEHIKSAITLKIDIEKVSKKINELSTILAYETFSGIKISKLEPNNPQFSRCDKAINDNIRPSFFKDTFFSSIKLCSAFKIENSPLLKSFEKKIKNSENSILKGIFISVSESQIPGIAIFGFSTSEFLKNQASSHYFKNFFRLPYEYMGKTNIEKFLKETKGFTNEIYGSSFSTLLKDEKKIISNNNCIIYLLLCRAIFSRSKTESGLNPETQEFKITDFSTVYPEYILICTKEKSNFEIVPTKNFIIPVKLTDLNYSNQACNKMSVENFYDYCNKAFNNSQTQRNKIKSEILTQIDTFWANKNIKQGIANIIIESKKKFIDKVKAEIESLRKEISVMQRHTESLKQIKNIRCRNQSI